MTFTIVIDNDLHFSLLELAAILDLELKSQEHYYRPLFQKLLDENNNDEIVNQLNKIPHYFLRNFSRNSFEPSTNLYIHIINLISSSSSSNINSIDLFLNLLENIDPNNSKNNDIKDLQVPSDVILISLTNVFNSLPNTSNVRLNALLSIVNIIVNDKISGTIQNIAKNLLEWTSTIENIDFEQLSNLVSLIFNQYFQENEKDSLDFVKSLILSGKIKLNSNSLITFYSKVLSSFSIYNINDIKSSIEQTNDQILIKLLNYYLIGDYKNYITSKSEFESANFANQIDFNNLDSTFKSLSILNYLASSISDSNSISYSSISQSTNIPINEIESQLISLITDNLIVAKLSQSNNSIIINSINYSSPTLALNDKLINWNEIGTLLNSWNENINNLQSIVQTLIVKRGKRVNAPAVIMAFHQQKLEAKEAREKKNQQSEIDSSNNAEITNINTESETKVEA